MTFGVDFCADILIPMPIGLGIQINSESIIQFGSHSRRTYIIVYFVIFCQCVFIVLRAAFAFYSYLDCLYLLLHARQ